MYLEEIYTKISDIFPDCICEKECYERGKIVWNDEDGVYIHLRIDQCVIKDEPIKRADCAIFSQYNCINHIYLYIIEVKDNWYSLSDIREKIFLTYQKLNKDLEFINEKITIIPVLYANRHISNARRTFHAYTITFGSKNQSIKYLHNGINIINAL